MKKYILFLMAVLIGVFAVGCCGSVDKAKDMADSAKEFAEAADDISKDMQGLRDDDGNFELTKERINRFLKNYPVFVKVIMEKDEKVVEDPKKASQVLSNVSEVASLDKDLRKAGIDNTAEFYLSYSEIMAGVTYINYEKAREEFKGEMDQQVIKMKEQLKNPDLPEEQKAMIESSIGQLQEQQEKAALPDNITEEELELIRENLDEILETTQMNLESEEKPQEEMPSDAPSA